MTSLRDDTGAPDFSAEAQALLSEVSRAGASLAGDPELGGEVQLLVKELGQRLHAEDPSYWLASVDPVVRAELLGAALVCAGALDRGSRRELRVGLEQVRHLLRDVVEERPAHPDRDPREVAAWLVEVTAAPQADVAEVLGVAPRTLQRWLSSAGASAPTGAELGRLLVVAAIVAQLRHSFTGPGALRWFIRPHPQLNDRAPIELLDDPGEYPQLRALASRARSMVAT